MASRRRVIITEVPESRLKVKSKKKTPRPDKNSSAFGRPFGQLEIASAFYRSWRRQHKKARNCAVIGICRVATFEACAWTKCIPPSWDQQEVSRRYFFFLHSTPKCTISWLNRFVMTPTNAKWRALALVVAISKLIRIAFGILPMILLTLQRPI